MIKTVLFVLTSHRQLGTSGRKTGSWLEELAQPYYVFVDAGTRVDFASTAGGEAPIDPMSLEDAWKSPVGERFLKDATAMSALRGTARLEDMDAATYDAIFLVGGAGGAWDFPGHPPLKAAIETVDRRGGVVAAVCHGAVALADAVNAEGMPLVRGRPVTSVSNAEDAMAGFDKIVPVLPEDALRRAGAFYIAAPPFGPNVQKDGNLITGQNPASARPLAEAVLARLG